MRDVSDENGAVPAGQIYSGAAAVEKILFRAAVRDAEERSKLRTGMGGLPVGGAEQSTRQAGRAKAVTGLGVVPC